MTNKSHNDWPWNTNKTPTINPPNQILNNEYINDYMTTGNKKTKNSQT